MCQCYVYSMFPLPYMAKQPQLLWELTYKKHWHEYFSDGYNTKYYADDTVPSKTHFTGVKQVQEHNSFT